MKFNRARAFTLIELLIVVTVIAILGAISAVSYRNYSSVARDSVRLEDMAKLEKALLKYRESNASLPDPENALEIVATTAALGYQGIAGGAVLPAIGIDGKSMRDPKDRMRYSYATDADGNTFQLLGFLENDPKKQTWKAPDAMESAMAESLDYSKRFMVLRGNDIGTFVDDKNVPLQFAGTGTLDISAVSDAKRIAFMGSGIVSTGSTGLLSLFDARMYPQKSCLNILKNHPGSGDGVYELSGSTLPPNTRVYCDMTTEGGGWMLVAFNRGLTTIVPNTFFEKAHFPEKITSTEPNIASSMDPEAISQQLHTKDIMLVAPSYANSPYVENGFGELNYNSAKCSGIILHTSRTAGCTGQPANNGYISDDAFNIAFENGGIGIVPGYSELCYS